MKTFIRIFLSILLLGSLAITLISPLRNFLKNSLFSTEKEILAQISSDLLNNGELLQILKVRTKDGLTIEIYPHPSQPKNKFQPVTLVIGDFHDAFLKFKDSAENLFVKDFNNDGIQEIVAPSFDFNWKTHLNIFKYNFATKGFEPASEESLTLNPF